MITEDQAYYYYETLNTVINGSQKIINAIDGGLPISTDKAIRASMKNSIALANTLKNIISSQVRTNKYDDSKKYDVPEEFEDLFSTFGKGK